MDKIGGLAETPPRTGPSATRLTSLAQSPLFRAAILAALALGLLRRLLFGLDTPLWLDETYTGAVAIQPTFRGLIGDSLNDVPPPVYYSFMWAWEKMFGPSNLSLRLPSLVFSLIAPLVILLKGHPDRFTRYMWAAFAALWIPGFFAASDARAYALLFLLGTVQIVLFMRVASTPTLRNALFWSGFSAFFILTHYHALLVTGLQGLGYVALKRKGALRTWPAALLFTPAAAWMAFHLPLVMHFSTPEVAWQRLLGPADIIRLPGILLELPRFSSPVLALIAGFLVWESWRRRRERGEPPMTSVEAWAIGASIVSIAVVFGLGFIRPNFATRYLIPFMPGALLAMAIWARLLAQRFRWAPWLVLAGLILFVLWETSIRARGTDWRAELSWETASSDLAEKGARRLIFAWDNPTSAVTPPGLMARVGSFFFKRAGHPIPVRPVMLAGRNVDPNLALLAAADRPGDAIIWVLDHGVPRTLASRYPPSLDKHDPKFQCRDYGRHPRGVVACIRPQEKRPPRPAVCRRCSARDLRH